MSTLGKKTYAAVVPESWTDLIADYERFATRYRSLLPETIKKHKTYVSRFCSQFQARCPSELFASLSPASIQRFLFQYARDYGPGSRRSMLTSLRAFLRFCHHRQYLATDLSAAAPSVHRRRLASVPKAIEEAAAEQLLDAIDVSRPLGMRDHAIVEILHTYGVRGIHVRKLRLPDIHWRESRIDFASTRGGKPISEYLTPEVGNSLWRYIQLGRPRDTPYTHVFLTGTRPPHPFYCASTLSALVGRHWRRTDIRLPDGLSKGTHPFRHGFARRMVDHEVPLKVIGDMLGHRDLNSTFIYSKVDLQALQHAALDWPQEVSL